MKRPKRVGRCAGDRERGFSLLELVVAATMFVVIAGTAFGLLGAAQKRYQTDSRILSSFQEARLGLDQIVRDVNDSGYPPPNHFSVLPESLSDPPPSVMMTGAICFW